MEYAMRVLLFAALALCGAACPAKSVWVCDAQRLYQVGAATGVVTKTVDEPGIVSLAADRQGGVWALTANKLTHISAPAKASDVEIPLALLDISAAGSMRLDPYDDAVWVTDGDRLVRVSPDGQVAPPVLVPEQMADWVVGLDQTLWLLGSKSLRQYGRFEVDGGRLLTSHALDGLKGPPSLLAIDSLRDRAWLGGDKTLSLVDLTGQLARVDLDLQEPLLALSVDQRTGTAWALSKAGLMAFAPTVAGQIAVTPLPADGMKIDRSSMFVLDQTGKFIWLAHASGLSRVDAASHVSNPVLAAGDEPLVALSSPAFSVTPTLLLVSPKPPGALAAGTELVFRLGARCPDGPCVPDPHYFEGIGVESVLGAQRLAEANIDPAARLARVLVPTLPAHDRPLTLVARAVDSLGHASAAVTEHFPPRPTGIVAGRPASGSARPITASPALSGDGVAATVALGPRPPAATESGAAAFTELAASTRRRPVSRPIALEINQGQHHPDIKFYAKAPAGDAYLTKGQLILGLRGKASDISAANPSARNALALADRAHVPAPPTAVRPPVHASVPTVAVQLSFVGANREPEVEGLDPLKSYSSYFVGSDTRQWRTKVPHYARARFKGLYPGIDAIYSGESGSLEYDFIVAAGADPNVIRQQVDGAEAMTLTPDGRLAVQTGAGEVFLSRPVIYQVSPSNPGRHIVEGGFVIQGANRFGFWVGAYDKTLPLVIDPVVVFTGQVLASQKIAVDASSNIYVASVNLYTPVTSGPLTNFGTHQTLLVQKVSADGATVLWNAFFGGSSIYAGNDRLTGLAVDAAGSAYITGNTPNADFPTTPGAFQAAKRSPDSNGHEAAFVAKLSPTGDSLVYSTFLSGSVNESANGIALDESRNAYITGHTNSSDFPRTAGNFSSSGGSGFLVKLSATGSALVYSDVMGGLEVSAPLLDSAGNTYVAGTGQLGALPVTGTGYHGAQGYAGSRTYLLHLNPGGTQIAAIATLGSTGYCTLSPMWTGRDSLGAVYLGGQSNSCNAESLDIDPALIPFPAREGRVPFVAKFSPDLSSLAYLFMVTASAENLPNAFAVDSDGSVYVAGSNYYQADFPYFNVIPGTPAIIPAPQGSVAQYLTKINPAGKGLVFASSLSADNPSIQDLTVDITKNIYALGYGAIYKVAAPETLAVALSSSKGSLLLGKPLTLNARVSGGSAPTGSVDFFDGSTLIGNAPLAAGVATLSTSSLSAATHSLTAHYQGDASNAATVSQAITQLVFAPAPSTTSLSVNATLVPAGSAVVFQSYISEDLQSGTVLDESLPRTLVLREGSTVLATVSNPPHGGLSSTVTLSNLPVGTHAVVAYFSGTEEVLPSQSDPVSVTVVPLTPPVATIELTPLQTPLTPPANYSVTVNASATGSATIQSVRLTEAFGPTTLFSGPLAEPPYVYPVVGKLEGAYQYTAVVTDSNGLATTVSTNAVVHQAPTVSITSPLAGAVLQAPLDLSITARTSIFDPYPYARGPDSPYPITRLEFVEGLITYPASVPGGSLGLNVDINATVEAIPPGTHTLRARVADGYGGETLSEPITFTVNPVPGPSLLAASWVSVSSGQTVSVSTGGFFGLTVAAANAGSLTLFQLYEGATLVQQQRIFAGSSWTFDVRTTPGVHNYRAVVSNGSVSASTTVLTLNVVAGQAGPTIAMRGPLDGASFAAGSSITFPIDARPGTNGLQRIDLYQGATLIGSSSSSVNFEWANVPAGEYSITAVATDNAGFRTQTAPVRISVGAPLTVALTAPADRASFTAPASFSLTANAAAAAGGSIARVEFYQGATLIGTATAPPYSVAFSSAEDGTFIFTARGYTATTGAVAVSTPIQVLVETPATPGVPRDNVVYLHTDAAGSPIAATNQSGAVVWRESYKPFGERHVHPTADAGTRQYFHGKPADAESGLSYFGARYFDPVAGRFMGADPVGFHEGNLHSFNRYAYGNNNPYRYRDPDGRLVRELAIGAAIFGLGAMIFKTPEQQRAMVLRLQSALDTILNSDSNEVAPPAPEADSEGKKESNVRENNSKGKKAEDEVASDLEGEGRQTERQVRKDTPFGPRIIDIEVKDKDGNVKGGVEVKSGNSRYRQDQRSKDEWLRQNGYPVDVVRKP